MYLEALAAGHDSAQSAGQAPSEQPAAPSGPSDQLTERTANNLTDGLMYRINSVMEQSEAFGNDPEDALSQSFARSDDLIVTVMQELLWATLFNRA